VSAKALERHILIVLTPKGMSCFRNIDVVSSIETKAIAYTVVWSTVKLCIGYEGVCFRAF
jgi:hypothetical protein